MDPRDQRIAEQDRRIAELEREGAELKQLVATLMERLRRNSRNSHSPPSSDGPGSRSTSEQAMGESKKERGGQPGHGGHERKMLPTDEVDHVVRVTTSLARARLATMVAVLVVCGPVSSASAAAFWYLERGASAYGRGGANIAEPGDPSALYINPSGLAGLSGLQLVIDANMLFEHRAFTRAPDDLDGDGDPMTYETVENRWSPTVPSPSLFATWNLATLGVPSLTVACGVWGPPQIDREWDPDGPQRYSEISYASRQVHYGLGAGVELPWKGLRLGATAMLIDQRVRTSLKLSAAATLGASPERPDYDVLTKVDASERAIFSGVLSISLRPIDGLTLAASYQPPYNARARGKAHLELGDEIAALATVSGERIRIALDVPGVVRLAARAGWESWDAELAWVWEGWGRTRRVTFEREDLSVTIPGFDVGVRDFDILFAWRDTWSLRAGGSLEVLPQRLQARAGAYYERSAVAKEWVTPATFDFDKIGLTAGGRVEVAYGVWADVALGYVHYLAGTISDSEQGLRNPIPAAGVPDTLWPVANGDYESRKLFFLFAAGIELDV